MKVLFELIIKNMRIVAIVDTYASSFKDLNHIRVYYSVPKWRFCRELDLLHDTQVVNDSRSFTNYIFKVISNDIDAFERKYMSFLKELSVYENYPDSIPTLKNY